MFVVPCLGQESKLSITKIKCTHSPTTLNKTYQFLTHPKQELQHLVVCVTHVSALDFIGLIVVYFVCYLVSEIQCCHHPRQGSADRGGEPTCAVQGPVVEQV